MGRDDFAASAAYQPEPTAVAAARRFVRDTLQEWIITGAAADGHGLVDDAVLLTSELVTNAVVHAGTPVQVACRLADDEVEVVVSDGDPASLVPDSRREVCDPGERTSGRGLLLPAALASAWGVAYGRAAKAVWFRLGLSGPAGGAGDSLAGDGRDGPAAELDGAVTDAAALVAALRHAPVARPGGAARPGSSRALPGPGVGGAGGVPEDVGAAGAGPGAARAAAGRDFEDIAMATVESARATVGADAAYVLMADDDGELRLRAAVGGVAPEDDEADGPAGRQDAGTRLAAVGGTTGVAASIATVPLVVDGCVAGLLAAASGTPGRFGEDDMARLQRLADRWGPSLERARLSELERRRRGRLGALAEARALLGGRLDREEAMALVGRAAVPRLADWCAVLLVEDDAVRTAFARHAVDDRSAALTGLLDRLCEVAGPALAGTGPGGTEPTATGPTGTGPTGTGRRWPFPGPDQRRPPAEADGPAGDDAWCFPFEADDVRGAFVIGHRRHERLSREVTELAADLACRIGIGLQTAARLAVGER